MYPTISLLISMFTVPKETQNLVQIRKIPIITNIEFFFVHIINVLLIKMYLYIKLILR